MNQNIYKIIILFKKFIRHTLGVLADMLIKTSQILGYLYTKGFGFVDTSWYDHRYDHLRGVENFYWMERAFLVLSMMSSEDNVLDLGCGDGIFSGVFYSSKAKKVVAVDIDSTAIRHAKKYYPKKNVSYTKQDIRNLSFRNNKFNIILMFAVIEHFTPEDGVKVLTKVGKLLKPNGTFFGSTPIFSKNKTKLANFEHENEFTSSDDLLVFLKKGFKSVKITHSKWGMRDECYFECKNPLI
jgi:2-polyprenyl-3-methyl-5-hydroxy-6-metoxy-1,4-benzoquinol methylase